MQRSCSELWVLSSHVSPARADEVQGKSQVPNTIKGTVFGIYLRAGRTKARVVDSGNAGCDYETPSIESNKIILFLKTQQDQWTFGRVGREGLEGGEGGGPPLPT